MGEGGRERGGGDCDDRCPYCLRGSETHNESGRCVSQGSLPPLLNHLLSLVSVLTLLELNTTVKTNPVWAKVHPGNAMIFEFYLSCVWEIGKASYNFCSNFGKYKWQTGHFPNNAKHWLCNKLLNMEDEFQYSVLYDLCLLMDTWRYLKQTIDLHVGWGQIYALISWSKHRVFG